MISRFHVVQLKERLNGNPLWASQVSIGKMAEICKRTTKRGAKEAAARKLFQQIFFLLYGNNFFPY